MHNGKSLWKTFLTRHCGCVTERHKICGYMCIIYINYVYYALFCNEEIPKKQKNFFVQMDASFLPPCKEYDVPMSK